MGFFKSEIKPRTVVIMGVGFDEFSTFMKGAGLGPASIRAAYSSSSTNRCTESGHDLADEPRLCDVGDLEIEKSVAGYESIEQAASAVLEHDARLLSLGGDHAITFPLLKAHARKYGPLEVLHLDAHPDLYDEFEGNRYSHACPFARIMEDQLASRLVQVGIRTATPHQRAQARRFGVQTVPVKRWHPDIVFDFTGPLYLSLDLDVLDPAFAPGVSHWEPGGLSTRDLIKIVQEINVPLVGADIVELNPKRDPTGITAMVAAKLFKEIAEKMLDSL